MEASIFSGESTLADRYAAGQVVLSDRRTDVTVDQVWNYYNDKLTANGWSVTSGQPSVGAAVLEAEFSNAGRSVTIKCYNTDSRNGSGGAIAAGYRAEIWYK